MFEIATIAIVAGLITALKEIIGVLLAGRKKTIDYMAKKIIAHDAIKQPLEAHEQRFIPNCNLFQTNKIINTLTQKINNRLNSCV